MEILVLKDNTCTVYAYKYDASASIDINILYDI